MKAMEMTKVAVFVAHSVALVLGLAQSFEFNSKDLETEDSLWDLYEKWSRHYNVSRHHSEKQMRLSVFKEKAKYVFEFNKKDDSSFELELNKFNDMTDSEVENFISCYDPSRENLQMQQRGTDDFMYHNKLHIPSSIYRLADRWVLSPLSKTKAYVVLAGLSAADAVAGIKAIMTGELLDLSAQQLLDCEKRSGACCGGSYLSAFAYIKKTGITTEKNYPYNCSTLLPPLVRIDYYQRVPAYNELALKEAVANQPISVSTDARSPAFNHYKRGIFRGPCGRKLHHVVTIVGYGSDTKTGLDYWIVKNSWGSNWRQQGYIYMERGISAMQGLCGIAMLPFLQAINSSTGISSTMVASSLQDEI